MSIMQQASPPVSFTVLPPTVDLTLYAGDDFSMVLNVFDNGGLPVDLTGVTAEAQIRANAAADIIEADFICTVGASGANTVQLVLASVDSAVLPSSCVWDCQLTFPGGVILTICAGKITMTAEVTRP
jgi:hypothetical protein